jgi:serine/threonine-protein kinase HipA
MAFSDTRTVRRSDFEEFGRRIKLPQRVVQKEIDLFAREQPLVKELLERSFLSPELQEHYLYSFNHRRNRLND